MIEVEVRSFVDEKEYERLLSFFRKNAEFLGEDDQTTYYLSGEHDLRVQKGGKSAKVWMKEGEMHDPHREEREVRISRDDFEAMVEIFKRLGFGVDVKWFRNRRKFLWKGVRVALDRTQNYGLIVELEKGANEKHKEEVYEELSSMMESLGVEITPRSEFQARFDEYVERQRSKLKS